MKEYIILQHLTASQLEDKVIDKLRLGCYVPIGGVTISISQHGVLFIQAMILKRYL